MIATATLTYVGWLAYWNATSVPNGTYSLQSVASYAGGVSGPSAHVTITVDNVTPTTTVLVPSNNATVSGSSVALDASTSSGVTSVQYQLSGGSLSGDTMIAIATLTPYGWIAVWNSTTVSDGTYQLESVATDAGGNSGTSAPVTITVDN